MQKLPVLQKFIEGTRERLATLDQDVLDKADTELAIDFEEHFQYQETQAHAHAMEWLSTEDAQIIYVALGEVGDPDNGGWARGVDLATKVIVSKAVAELLKKKIQLVAATN